MIKLSAFRLLCINPNYSTLTLRQIVVLCYLHEKTQNISIRKMNISIGLPNNAMTRALKGLEDKGLVLKHQHIFNPRNVTYTLTYLGQKAISILQDV